MLRIICYLLILCIGLPFLSCERHIPEYVVPCHRDDPDINTCVRNVVKALRPHLSGGVPEMLIPPLDPLDLPRVELATGQSFNITFTNIKLKNADKFIVDDVKVDFAKDHVDLKVTFPIVNGSCQYDVSGKILILQLEGHGPARVNCSNVHADISVDFEKYMKNGSKYLKIKDVSLKVDLGSPDLWFDKLFPDDKLNEQTNKVVNDNVVEILQDLAPAINNAVIQFTTGVIGRILNRFSFDELFP